MCISEEMRSSTAMVLSSMMCLDLIINKEKHGDLLEASRKVCSFMSRKLGVSREDLPAVTKVKLDQLTTDTSVILIF